LAKVRVLQLLPLHPQAGEPRVLTVTLVVIDEVSNDRFLEAAQTDSKTTKRSQQLGNNSDQY